MAALENLKFSLSSHIEIGDSRLQSAINDFEVEADMDQRSLMNPDLNPKTIRSILAKGSNLNLKQVIAAHL